MIKLFNKLKIWVRLVILILILHTFFGIGINLWIITSQKEIAVNQARDMAQSVEQMVVSGITTMMFTNTMPYREIFLSQINKSTGIQNLRVVRGDAVVQQYGKGLDTEMNVTPLEKRVLDSGKPYFRQVTEGDLFSSDSRFLQGVSLFFSLFSGNRKEYLEVVTPIFASVNYLGKNCLSCHKVPENTVLGAISMSIPMKQVNDATRQFSFELYFIGLGLFAAIIAVFYLFAKKNLDTPFTHMIGQMEKIAGGDLSINLVSVAGSDMQRLTQAMHHMVENLSELIRQINQTSTQTSKEAESLLKTSTNLSESAQNLAASTEQSSAAVEELGASVDFVADSVKNSTLKMKSIEKSVEMLVTAISTVNNSVLRLEELTRSLSEKAEGGERTVGMANEKMGKIQASSSRITEIIAFITDISDKINLLSLNAAIEAARAGSAGYGFAVVADEISKLADHTMASVKEIKNLIVQTNQAVKEGTEMVSDASGTLSDIIHGVAVIDEFTANVRQTMAQQKQTADHVMNNVQEFSRLSTEVENATIEQKNTTGEFSLSLQTVSQEAQSVSQGSRDLSIMAEEMSRNAELLKTMVEQFRISETTQN